MSIFSRIEEVRKRAKLSQADFAKALGIGKSTQIRYEKGDVWPAMDYLQKVAEVFGSVCDYNWLVTGYEITAAEKGEIAIATVLTRLARMMGVDDDLLTVTREACQQGDPTWEKLLEAAVDRADAVRLSADERALVNHYRCSNAQGKQALRVVCGAVALRGQSADNQDAPPQVCARTGNVSQVFKGGKVDVANLTGTYIKHHHHK